ADEEHRPRGWDALSAHHRDAVERPEQHPPHDHVDPDPPGRGDGRRFAHAETLSGACARTTASSASTLCSKSSSEVSTRCTPGAASVNWETVESSASRRTIWSRVASTAAAP